jgi:two-component system NtrC family sensor kinase
MNVNDAALSVLAITRQQLLNQGIELKITLPDGLPPVLGDINQIEQVLLNLFANASDAMEESPDKLLTIETALSEKGQMVQIKVSDTGVGMTSEQIEQIFNPFFTTKDADKGMGLGLSISYRIIESHRGKIEVRSKQGKGTTFIVELPVYVARSEIEKAKENSGG